MKKISFLNKFKKYLSPQENAGAFEVNDKTIKCFYFEPNTYKISYYDIEQLKPGTIEKGEIKNLPEFEKTLLKIKNKRKKFFKNNPYIILSLPAENFFTTVIEVPKDTLNFSNLEDTVKLNIESITPIPLEEGYLDWESIEEEGSENLSIFTGIGKKSSIDIYLSCFYKNGFKVLAVEKPALGLSRFVFNYSNIKVPYLLVNIDRDGVDFLIADDKKIYFYDFDE
ncbi:MAG: pilus assembly protein PilM [Candidatus Pacebacteria bacterium]|nr:pilus assembly protein PilM [Candidatus Paceibacterota bacterium]